MTDEIPHVVGYTAGYQVQTDSSGQTTLHKAWEINQHATSPVVAGGVLYIAVNGNMLALDPQTGKTLWQSSQSTAGGTIGQIHWESPIVVNGHVYVTDEDGNLYSYGI